MSDNNTEVLSIIIVDQPSKLDICSLWSRSFLVALTKDESDKLKTLAHQLSLELRPILARMEHESIPQNLPPRKRMPN
jgi:hypothetical protein